MAAPVKEDDRAVAYYFGEEDSASVSSGRRPCWRMRAAATGGSPQRQRGPPALTRRREQQVRRGNRCLSFARERRERRQAAAPSAAWSVPGGSATFLREWQTPFRVSIPVKIGLSRYCGEGVCQLAVPHGGCRPGDTATAADANGKHGRPGLDRHLAHCKRQPPSRTSSRGRGESVRRVPCHGMPRASAGSDNLACRGKRAEASLRRRCRTGQHVRCRARGRDRLHAADADETRSQRRRAWRYQ